MKKITFFGGGGVKVTTSFTLAKNKELQFRKFSNY